MEYIGDRERGLATEIRTSVLQLRSRLVAASPCDVEAVDRLFDGAVDELEDVLLVMESVIGHVRQIIEHPDYV
jgi:hypothetical protein